MRKTKEQLEKIKKKYNVSELWSWSKYNTYKTDPYGYLLKYILKEKETKASIYGVSGGNVHDIIESFYLKERNFDDLLEAYEDKLLEMNLANLKYNRKDKEANKKIASKYENNIREFFKHHEPIESKVITEQFVTIKVGKNIFQGYIDFVYKDEDGFYNIIDWKTSTIYVGKKIDKEKGQLVLYAESLIQRGIPIDKIKIKWNFVKYCTIKQELLTKGKTRNKNCLRTEWVKGIEPTLRKWFTKLQYDPIETEMFISEAIENNNLDNMPDEIKGKFEYHDCYVEIPLNEEVIAELKIDIENTIHTIRTKEVEYQNTKDDKLFWTEIDKSNEFFFVNLCGYSPNQHKPYKAYLDELNFMRSQKEEPKDDLDWLNKI